MVIKAVEALWVWKFNVSAFGGTYGRLGGGRYTHDFVQSGGKDAECGSLLSRMFGVVAVADERQDIIFQWPGGHSAGFVSYSSDRFHVGWGTSQAPLPWKLSPNPTEGSAETIPGDPARSDITGADAEWDALDARGLDPYLVAVKLRGEQNSLHIRAYLANPPSGMEWAALDQTPAVVRSVARSTGPKNGCAALEVKGGVTAEPEVADLVAKLEDNPNVLLFGPPGTGKTILLEKLVHFVEHSAGGLLFDPDVNHPAFSEDNAALPGLARTVVLHPAYTYENLVVGLLPEPSKNGVVVRPAPGPLVNLAQYASEPGRRGLLVLDEFNRGNAAAVLGDTIALLDKDKRGRSVVALPYSDLGIDVPAPYANSKGTTVPSEFTLPPNLWMVAAMNSSDRSVAPLDAALRRRFSIVEMPPNYDVLAQNIGADEDANLAAPLNQWTPGTVAALAVDLLRSINDRIDAVLGSDFRLGQSNFWGVGGKTNDEAIGSLAAAFDYRVVSTLRLAMQDDDGALAAVLRAGSAESPKGTSTAVAHWQKGNADLGTYASARLHFRQLSKLPSSEAAEELLRQAGH